MRRCLALAERGAGSVAPNPMVGAVIMADGTVVGEGYHQSWGEAHAEVNAIRAVTRPELLRHSTLYVSLEPCCHFGKTPPCTDAIIEARIPRVVVATRDPFDKVSGGGIERLRQAGVEVIEGVLCREATLLNRRFFTFHLRKRPFVVLKWAQTDDRFIARSDYTSRWISGPESRALVHRWRAEESAVLVGFRTALVDDPELTVRLTAQSDRSGLERAPLRVAIDPRGELPETLRLFDGSTPTAVITAASAPRYLGRAQLLHCEAAQHDDPHTILSLLHQRSILSVLIEGGAAVLNRFIAADLWDEARVFTAPTRFHAGIAAPILRRAPDAEQPSGEDRLALYTHPSLRTLADPGWTSSNSSFTKQQESR